MPIALIAAVAGKRLVIGKDGDMPWHFPADLKFFKEKTMGHTVLMGRVTHQSILKRLGKPLPNRRTIVMTRDNNFYDDRVTIVHDWKSANAIIDPSDWGFIVGGANIFNQSINRADILYITHIDQEIDGDTFFPPIDSSEWKLTNEEILIEKGTNLRFCEYKPQS